jgi:hypothetical protein
MEGFMFNGNYWVGLSLHNSELKKDNFDNLYLFLCADLNADKIMLSDQGVDIEDEDFIKFYNKTHAYLATLNSNKT